MSDHYIVVDGSNIATEGRETPSLAQLDEAVRAFMQGRAGGEEIIVVVDATFGHRIDPSEKAEYEQAERAGEIVSPPAGAVGRGDAFLLQVADRTNAVVLSNDSFQEFHAEYPWLFDDGRLIGGKPVPKVGWFFTPRTPVRGPKSREAMRAAKKAKKASLKRAVVAEGPVAEAIAEATAEAISPDLDEERESDDDTAADDRGGKRARRRRAKPVGAVNDPLPFIQFIADHPLGSEVEGEVDLFTSHGAFVRVGDARCYVPLSALGDPAPRSAKAVLTRGEVRTFVVQALDPPRRGVELALPGSVRVAGTPTEETVEADIGAGRTARRRKKAAPELVAAAVAVAAEAVGPVEAAEPGDAAAGAEPTKPARSRRTRKAAAPAEEPAATATPTEPVGEPAAEPVPTRARRARKAAAAAAAPETAVEEAPALPVPVAAKATRARKKKAAAEPEAIPLPAAPAAPAAEARVRRTRKAAAVTEDESTPEPVPAKARRSGTKAAAAAVAPADPAKAPAKATRKRTAAKKAAAPGSGGEPEVAPAPVKRARKKSAG